ncbi:MAG: hypothetical protein M3Q09_07530 [Gemmatimonadota bacterium]|nr:hypothetical protein [Gemmatimonadota bacterium]
MRLSTRPGDVHCGGDQAKVENRLGIENVMPGFFPRISVRKKETDVNASAEASAAPAMRGALPFGSRQTDRAASSNVAARNRRPT